MAIDDDKDAVEQKYCTYGGDGTRVDHIKTNATACGVRRVATLLLSLLAAEQPAIYGRGSPGRPASPDTTADNAGPAGVRCLAEALSGSR